MRRSILLVVVSVLSLSTALVGVLPGRAEAATPVTVTFTYTGAAQPWTVPDGVTQVTIDAYGAQGGGRCPEANGSIGAGGGRSQNAFPVTEGETLQVYVGENPTGYNGGFNGGGWSSRTEFGGGCGGGGASDVRQGGTGLENRIIVAGGGGGIGWADANPDTSGGFGGGLNGGPGGSYSEGNASAFGGQGGSQGGGGLGGLADCVGAVGSGLPGTLGQGGAGTGGGGGGGFYGGGGGASCGYNFLGILMNAASGGGGGSGLNGAVSENGVRFGNGLVTITYSPADLPACSDGLDNDGDGLIDFPSDPGCTSAEDADETNAPPAAACSDGVDNDGDGLTDFPNDPGCRSTSDRSEADSSNPPNRQCSDGIDNDGDGFIDYPADPGCRSTSDRSEARSRLRASSRYV